MQLRISDATLPTLQVPFTLLITFTLVKYDHDDEKPVLLTYVGSSCLGYRMLDHSSVLALPPAVV